MVVQRLLGREALLAVPSASGGKGGICDVCAWLRGGTNENENASCEPAMHWTLSLAFDIKPMPRRLRQAGQAVNAHHATSNAWIRATISE